MTMGAALKRHPRFTALTLGALSATGFQPLGLWPLTLLCVALLCALLLHASDAKRAFALGYVFGLGQFVVGLNWIARAFAFQDSMPHWLGYVSVFLLSLYLAVYPAVATTIAWRMARGGKEALVLCLAASWLLTEYLRATLFTGFAWNPLGAIWLDTGVAQAATVVGTYGLGAMAVLVGGALWLAARRRKRSAMVILFPMLAIALIGLTENGARPTSGAAIAVVQPNVGLSERNAPGYEEDNFRRLAALTRANSGRSGRLVFWPEAAVPAILDMEPGWRERIAATLAPGDLLMTGGDKYHMRQTDLPYYRPGDLIGANNSLWVLTPDARLIARYDKAHLVPYGEYLPMRTVLSAIGLSRLVPGDVDFWPGPGPRTLALPGAGDRPPLRMAVQICYEIIFSGQVIDPADRPDFLFNPSNDAWFGPWGPPQHLAQARLRAIEEAVPVIRSTPTGISAVIDARGTVVGHVPADRAGTIAMRLPAAAPPTLFAQAGNSLPLLLAGMLLLGGVAMTRSNR